jgi:hypothetical protein
MSASPPFFSASLFNCQEGRESASRMRHPTEHTLELFALGSARLGRERKRVQAHLERCGNCRARLEEITRIYEEAEAALASDDQKRLTDSFGLIRRAGTGLARREPDHVAVHKAPRSLLREFRDIIRQNPVASGFSGLALVGACAVAALTMLRTTTADTNPAFYQYNTAEGLLEIYNKEDTKLWQKGIWDAAVTQAGDGDGGRKITRVVDLDGDGRNEVATLALLKRGDDRPRADVLTIFQSDKSVRMSEPLGRESWFGSRHYDGRFGASDLIPVDSSDGSLGLLVSLSHYRSPHVVVRLDGRGERVGEYWHYGHLATLESARIDGEPGPVLIGAGINDAADSAGNSYGAVIVLDPMKLQGMAESALTRGFGLPASDAELYYVRFPLTDMEIATGLRGSPGQREKYGLQAFIFTYRHNQVNFGFDYEFDRSMRVVSVRINTGTEAFHKALKDEGKITSELNLQYADNLRRGILYWDGQRWVASPTRFRRSSLQPLP